MFLSMLTADAAASHGHEFSTRQPGIARRSPIPRSPLSVLPTAARQRSPQIPARPSALNPDYPNPSKSPRTIASVDADMPPRKTPDPINIENISPGRDGTVSPNSTYHLEDEPPSSSQPGELLPVDGVPESPSDAAAKRRVRRRAEKKKITYLLAHHPPLIALRQLLHQRPHSLLQLQRSFPDQRPLPAFEVLPASRVEAKTRQGKRIGTLHNHAGKLCGDDLVIVQARWSLPPGKADDRLDDWDVVGIICASARDKSDSPEAQIFLEDATWTILPHKSGRYDLFSHDDQETQQRARWIVNKLDITADKDDYAPRKFKFAPMSFGTTRHPITGKLSASELEMYDTYTMPSPSKPSTPSGIETPDLSNFNWHYGSDPFETPEDMKTLMAVSGIFVAFWENWIPEYTIPGTIAAARKESPIPAIAPMTDAHRRVASIRSNISHLTGNSRASSSCHSGGRANSSRLFSGSPRSSRQASGTLPTMKEDEDLEGDCITLSPLAERPVLVRSDVFATSDDKSVQDTVAGPQTTDVPLNEENSQQTTSVDSSTADNTTSSASAQTCIIKTGTQAYATSSTRPSDLQWNQTASKIRPLSFPLSRKAHAATPLSETDTFMASPMTEPSPHTSACITTPPAPAVALPPATTDSTPTDPTFARTPSDLRVYLGGHTPAPSPPLGSPSAKANKRLSWDASRTLSPSPNQSTPRHRRAITAFKRLSTSMTLPPISDSERRHAETLLIDGGQLVFGDGVAQMGFPDSGRRAVEDETVYPTSRTADTQKRKSIGFFRPSAAAARVDKSEKRKSIGSLRALNSEEGDGEGLKRLGSIKRMFKGRKGKEKAGALGVE